MHLILCMEIKLRFLGMIMFVVAILAPLGGADAVECYYDRSFADIDEARDVYENENPGIADDLEGMIYRIVAYPTKGCNESEIRKYTTSISGDMDRLVSSCKSCMDGFVLKSDDKYTMLMDSESLSANNSGTPPCSSFPGFKYCVRNEEPSTCVSSTCNKKSGWESSDDVVGLEQYVSYACAENKCIGFPQLTKLRCAKNYYGNPLPLNRNKCSPCPTGATSNAGTLDISGCMCSGSEYVDAASGRCKKCPNPVTDYGWDFNLKNSDNDYSYYFYMNVSDSSGGAGISSCNFTFDSDKENLICDDTGCFWLAVDDLRTGGRECFYDSAQAAN